MALLRACQMDTKKPLIREAVDVLVPTLEEKLPRTADQRVSLWVRYTKKVCERSGGEGRGAGEKCSSFQSVRANQFGGAMRLA